MSTCDSRPVEDMYLYANPTLIAQLDGRRPPDYPVSTARKVTIKTCADSCDAHRPMPASCSGIGGAAIARD